MDDPSETLKSHITAVIEGLRHLDVDSAADLIAEVADDLAEGGPECDYCRNLRENPDWEPASARVKGGDA